LPAPGAGHRVPLARFCEPTRHRETAVRGGRKRRIAPGSPDADHGTDESNHRQPGGPVYQKTQDLPEQPQAASEIGTIYKATHQFQQAESYYREALQSDPKNAELRGDLAACLYYTGDVEGAIAQLQQSLKNQPNDANSLFNLGVMKWQGKKDADSAIAAWRQLLKSNPNLEPTKKAQVQQMIAEVGKGRRS